MKMESANISVAIAVYNGEKFIRQQLDSILVQLRDNDEIVVSLDPSTDRSEQVLREYCEADQRVRLVHGSGSGLTANFENAIVNCKNEIIFLADQDDIWHTDKVKKVLKCFDDPNTMVVLHDARVVDGDLKVFRDSFFQWRGSKPGIMKNIVKNSYMGCCMAFRRELCQSFLPMPKNIPMHDQWIGLIGEIKGKSVFLNEPLIDYRRHGNNASSDTHAGLIQMMKWRWIVIYNLVSRKIH
jgi:glycosyltransferase involved in cell wall biosynthesis